MKRLVAIFLTAVLVLGSVMALASCNDANPKDMVGVYELSDISGSITANGQTTALSKDLYEYYTIELKDGGAATVKSAGAGFSVEYEEEATWKYEDGKLKITSKPQGVEVTEVMDIKDGVITYETTQSTGGTVISMKIVLEKKQ